MYTTRRIFWANEYIISHKCYSNLHVLMTRSKTSKDSFRGFQMSSEISFLISIRKTFPTSGWCDIQKILVWELNGPLIPDSDRSYTEAYSKTT